MRKILLFLLLLLIVASCKKETTEVVIPPLLGKWLDTQSSSTDSTHRIITRIYEANGDYTYEMEQLHYFGHISGVLMKGTFTHVGDSILHNIQSLERRELPVYDWTPVNGFVPHAQNEGILTLTADSLRVYDGNQYNHKPSHSRIPY